MYFLQKEEDKINNMNEQKYFFSNIQYEKISRFSE